MGIGSNEGSGVSEASVLGGEGAGVVPCSAWLCSSGECDSGDVMEEEGEVFGEAAQDLEGELFVSGSAWDGADHIEE